MPYPFDNPVEVIWTLITGIGAAIAVYSVRDAYADYQPTRAKDGKPEVLALSSLRNETVFFVLQFLFFIVGVLAMAENTPSANTNDLRYVLAGIFIALAFMLALNSLVNRSVRKTLLENPNAKSR